MADSVAKTSTPDAAAGNPIDITTVTTGAGVVDRQCMSIGDPAANNRVAVTAGGAIPVNQGVPASNVSAWPVFLALSGNSSIGSVNVERWIGSTAPTVGQKTAAASLPVVLPSDVTGAVTVSGALPAGTNSIGSVNVLVLPALPAGTNSIGSVNVLVLPALPAGTNSIGTVFAQGMAASGAVVAGNPLLNGLRAATALPTVVAGTQAVAWTGDISGRGIVAKSPLALVGKGTVTLTSNVTTQLLALVSSVSWAIGTFYCTSSQTTATVRLDLFDNATLITSVNFIQGTQNINQNTAIYFDPPWVCGSGNSINVKSTASVTDIRCAITAYQSNG